jgi:hypothetical protein
MGDDRERLAGWLRPEDDVEDEQHDAGDDR